MDTLKLMIELADKLKARNEELKKMAISAQGGE